VRSNGIDFDVMADKNARKMVIGILGGICSGKSSVAGELGKLGCAVIDADEIAHKYLDQDHIVSQLGRQFGGGIASAQGGIDKAELAKLVFSDAERLKALTDLIHPLVTSEIEQLIEQYKADPAVPAIVLDVPLLVEIGYENRCDKLIFVDCDEKIRAERAVKKGFLDVEQLKNREKFQISLDRKKGIADNAVVNNSEFSELSRQVAEIFQLIISG